MSDEFKTQETLSQCKTVADLKKWVDQRAGDLMVKVEADMYIDTMDALMRQNKSPMVFEFSVREHGDMINGITTPGVHIVEFTTPRGHKMGWAIYMYKGKIVKFVPALPGDPIMAIPTTGTGSAPTH